MAAEAAIRAMTTYDHRSLAADFAWVETSGTARFREDFGAASRPVRELITELRASSVGEIIAAGTDIHDPDHIDVLVFVDQVITNEAAAGEAALEQPRVLVSMVRQEGRWLVDEVQLLTRTGAAPTAEPGDW